MDAARRCSRGTQIKARGGPVGRGGSVARGESMGHAGTLAGER